MVEPWKFSTSFQPLATWRSLTNRNYKLKTLINQDRKIIVLLILRRFYIHISRHKLMHVFKLQIPSSPLHIPHHICCSIPSHRLIHINYARRRRSVVTTAMASSANVASPELPSLKLNDGTFIPLVSPCARPSIPANSKSDWLWQLVFIDHRT